MGNKSLLVERYLMNIIETNKNDNNFKLPSENAICRILGVSRQACRPVLEKLQEKGFIYKRQGSGTYISSDAEKLLTRKKHSKKVIAVIVPEFSSNFMESLLINVINYANNDYSVLVFNSEWNSQKEIDCIKKAASFGAKGFVIYPTDNSNLKETVFVIKNLNVPAVFIDAKISGDKYVSVCSNNSAAVAFAVNYLINLGHKNIGIVGLNDNVITSDRLNGYKSCLKDHGLTFHKSLYLKIDKDAAIEQKKEQLYSFFKSHKRISAVIVLNSSLSLLAINALEEAKRKIPKNVSFIGYEDDFSSIINFIKVRISSIKQNIPKIAEVAIKNLTDLISGIEVEDKITYVTSDLKIRDTVKSLFV